MTFDPDDPKWTAYALDELDTAERTALERELAESPEAQRLVAEIRETVGLLEGELKSEPIHKLLCEQRIVIVQGATPKVELLPRRWKFSRKVAVELVVVAASVLMVIGLLLPASQRARKSDQRTQAMNNMESLQPSAIASATEKTDLADQSGYYVEDDVNYTVPHTGSGQLSSKSNRESVPRYAVVRPQYESSTKLGTGSVDSTVLGQKKGDKLSGANEAEAFYDRRPVESPDPQIMTDRSNEYQLNHSYSYTQTDGRTPTTKTRGRNSNSPTTNSTLERESRLPTDPFGGNGNQWGAQQSNQSGEAEKEAAMTVMPLFSQTGEVTTFNLRVRGSGYDNSEAYDTVTDNPFLPARENPLSTFSIDVDTASYSNVRRLLMQNRSLPPKGAVRIEELINYFRYDYPQPAGEVPFSVTTEVAGCPWNAGHRLVRVGLKGREIAAQKRPPSNLVFLLDVSGSMSDANKLPLVREAMKMLVEQLTENDRVAIVVYAGNSGLVLPSTTGDKQQQIRAAIDQLEAGGSTNGGQGIQLAYDLAAGNFIKGGTNRVILATDGDFNVGITGRDDLLKLIIDKAKSGVFLTTLGFGMGNLKDGTLEQLADKGNGNYAYIDDLREAKKVFVEQMTGTLITIAKDVKIQIEFNPAQVASYRLIGYENRMLAKEDFNDDKKDAGEIGAGHTVTALYELTPAAGGQATGERQAVDPLKYQKPATELADAARPGELLTLKLRYKQPDGEFSQLIETSVTDAGKAYGNATSDFKFAASVALFGMILRDSPYKGAATLDAAAELASEGLKTEVDGYRAEFVELIKRAKELGKR